MTGNKMNSNVKIIIKEDVSHVRGGGKSNSVISSPPRIRKETRNICSGGVQISSHDNYLLKVNVAWRPKIQQEPKGNAAGSMRKVTHHHINPGIGYNHEPSLDHETHGDPPVTG